MSQTLEQQIQEVEIDIKHAKEAIDMMNSLEKLRSNREFKKVFLEGYFEKEASRLVLIKAEPAMQGETEQKMIEQSINAIGYMRQYMHKLYQFGQMAERSLRESELTRDELMAGELEMEEA